MITRLGGTYLPRSPFQRRRRRSREKRLPPRKPACNQIAGACRNERSRGYRWTFDTPWFFIALFAARDTLRKRARFRTVAFMSLPGNNLPPGAVTQSGYRVFTRDYKMLLIMRLSKIYCTRNRYTISDRKILYRASRVSFASPVFKSG